LNSNSILIIKTYYICIIIYANIAIPIKLLTFTNKNRLFMRISVYVLTIYFATLCQGISASGIKDLLIKGDKPIKKIVLDAGHGGKDGGTHGDLYNEKDITLSITKLVGKMLNEHYPNLEVIYTRDSDEFIPLFERIGKANKKNADVFVSIHCNWIANVHTKGTETFVMGLHRADENLNVAKRENEAILMENDFQANYDGYDPNSPLGHIMLSIFQDQYLSQSIDLANKVEKQFKSRGYSTSRGVKQAGFAVLRRATMPSILIETGFLSNKEEEIYLGSPEGQNEVALNIFTSIEDFGNLKLKDETEIIAKVTPKNNRNTKSQSYRSEDKGQNIDNELVVSADVPVPTPTPVPSSPKSENMYYVQIAALQKDISTKLTNDKELAKIGSLSVAYDGQLYKYRVGEYASQEEARSAKEKLVSIGYTTCFLTSK
jgi:N-acetylmuramoyl-L-alanine amidase